MARHKITSVQYEISVQKSSRRFSVPKEVRKALRLQGKRTVHLCIRDISGYRIFEDDCEFKSGSEIYGQVAKALKPGQPIIVEASMPPGGHSAIARDAAALRLAGSKKRPTKKAKLAPEKGE